MHLKLTPLGPWIVRGHVKDEQFRNHRGETDSRQVLQPLLDEHNMPLLPASSLKGVLRSTAERILRTMHPNRDPHWIPLADDPFVHGSAHLAGSSEGSSGSAPSAGRLPGERSKIADSELREWLEQQPASWFANQQEYAALMKLDQEPRFDPERAAKQIYKLLSPASQLFGCTLHAGLLTLEDARAARLNGRRTHVAIDRFTGGVGEGPFIEALAPSDAPLTTTLTITNFALWQVGLLALVFQEINRGYVGVGGGTRKGQGQVRIEVPQVVVCYAEQAYPRAAGIISAQAQLAREPWSASVRDVPAEVQAVERGLVLLADLEPQPNTDWRAAGLRTLLVQEACVAQLFREAVQQAWRPWVQQMRREAA